VAERIGVSIDRYLLDITSTDNQLALLNIVLVVLQTPARHLGDIIEGTHTSGTVSIECPSNPEFITDPEVRFWQSHSHFREQISALQQRPDPQFTELLCILWPG